MGLKLTKEEMEEEWRDLELNPQGIKVLFLDIDGVMNSTKGKELLHDFYKGNPGGPYINYVFNKWSVDYLKTLTECHKFYIVLTSSMRNHSKRMVEMFKKNKLDHRYIIGKTPVIDNDWDDEYVEAKRGNEIRLFLIDNQELISDYVVLDDDDFDIKGYIPDINFVKTNPKYGLNGKEFNDILNVISPLYGITSSNESLYDFDKL
jgi:hypothetical protein